MKNSTSLKNTSAALCGIIFGAGLAISGMTDTQKVIGFLDIFGNWVPDLAFVMGSAVLVTLVGFRLVFKKQAPFFIGINYINLLVAIKLVYVHS